MVTRTGADARGCRQIVDTDVEYAEGMQSKDDTQGTGVKRSQRTTARAGSTRTAMMEAEVTVAGERVVASA